MTKDEIIAMAHNAELVYLDHGRAFAMWREDQDLTAPLQRFAALVAAREREKCAKVAEEFGPGRPIIARNPSHTIICRWEGEQAASRSIAIFIRARGEQA